MNKRLAIIPCMVLLASCSLTSPRDMGNAHQVFLAPLTEKIACHAHSGGNLTVAYPQAPDALDTYRIALVDQAGHWDYFAGMRWADFLPGNLQSALIATLSASKHFASVSSDDTVDEGRMVLESDIHRFEAVYSAGSSMPQATIDITFSVRKAGRLHADRQFTVSSAVTAQGNGINAVSQAFEKAFADIQSQAVSKITSCKT